MKRVLSLLLASVMLLGMLCGCQNTAGSDTTTTVPEVTQSAEEQEVLKILFIGNSHFQDACTLLYEVFQKEMPEQKLTIGFMYKGSARIAQHAENIRNNTPDYEYFKNTDGTWKSTKSVTIDMALADDTWDIVLTHQMNFRGALDGDYVAEDFKTLFDTILEKNAITPKLGFMMTWGNPDNYELYLNDDAPYSINAMFGQPTESWRSPLEKDFAGADGKYDMKLGYEKIMEKTERYMADTTNFLGKNYLDYLLPTGTAVMYAIQQQGRPQNEIFRDYTHLNDYGRLIAAYHIYAQLMGLTSIDDVKVDTIPARLHQSRSEYPAAPMLEVDAKMKSDLIASVNWALTNPYKLP